MNTPVKPAAVAAGTPRPQGCTQFKLRQLMRRVAQHYDAELGKAGLKTTQYSLLSYVVKSGPLRLADLASGMKMQPSTLTRNLQPLIAAGWFEMRPGADGRSRLVDATPAGRDKRSEAQRRWRAAQLGLQDMLGDAKVAALHTLIDDCMLQLEPLAEGTAHD